MMINIEDNREKIFFLKTGKNFLNDRKIEVDNKKDVKEKIEKFIFCKLCFNKITLNSEKKFINGRFSFEFINPVNIKYTIGCFSSAVGCYVYGIPTFEDTWFPDYAWSFVTCKKCNEHLGWYFQKEGDGFFGLILPKLEGDL